MPEATQVSLAHTGESAISEGLLQEIESFHKLCRERYRFNSFWDNIINAVGIIISVGIIACGVYKQSELAALLGGVVGALVTAQRAFPFNQRWQFYRLLDSQAANLLTQAKNNVVTVAQAIATLNTMRLDFAQQIPRGISFRSESSADDLLSSRHK